MVAIPGEPGMQAVALNINGDKALFYKIRLLGAQDTLMDFSGTHYFYRCYIEGSIDFIFGEAKSIYQVQGFFILILINWINLGFL